jgi:hypothetical protein
MNEEVILARSKAELIRVIWTLKASYRGIRFRESLEREFMAASDEGDEYILAFCKLCLSLIKAYKNDERSQNAIKNTIAISLYSLSQDAEERRQ